MNIIIVDDHPLYRIGIRFMVEKGDQDCVFLDEAENVATAMSLLKLHDNIDLLLLDLMLPDGSGIDVLEYVKKNRPEIKVLVISADNTEAVINRMLELDVDGFIGKSASDEELLTAIHEIGKGYKYYGKEISHLIHAVKVARQQDNVVFTGRELEIIKLCADGLKASEIADRLCISPHTVEKHKGNIFQKLGFNSTSELIKYAFHNGIVMLK